MKGKFFMLLPVVFILIAAGFQGTASGDETCTLCHPFGTDFATSLHHTAQGMEYWYSAANNGLELLTGVPYGDFVHETAGCKNCHKAGSEYTHGCENCHGTMTDPPTIPTQAKCLECHARESAVIAKDDGHGTPDVHRAAGMECMFCHSSREMHGDGTAYISLKEPGAMDTKCENCHHSGSLHPRPNTRPHLVHGNRLDCKACHERRVVSCYNCHMDTAAPYGNGARVAKGQIDDWIFLVNYNGKVTSANMQTFVGGDPDNITDPPTGNTALMFAPVHSHSIMSPGRTCSDCHGTATAKRIYKKRKINLTWLDGTTLMHKTGVIPVAAGTVYKFIAYDKDNTVGSGTGWVTLSDVPKKPNLKLYKVAFGKPLTRRQMLYLKTPQSP
jgi:hypothetical protein